MSKHLLPDNLVLAHCRFFFGTTSHVPDVEMKPNNGYKHDLSSSYDYEVCSPDIDLVA